MSSDPTGADGDGTAVSMEGISKYFGEVVALEDVDLELRRGEVLALVGDNGAGKSTLIKCLAGVHEPDAGEIRIDGAEVEITNPRDAKALGIETAYQDLALAGNLTVTQNVFLGREETTAFEGLVGVLDKDAMNERAAELLGDLEIDIDPGATVRDLSGGERQLVALSRTLLSDPEIIIMDEPTSALSVEGADRVLALIDRLRDQGISIILISHNLEYTREVADRVQVLFHGRNAGVLDAQAATRDGIVSRMIGGHLDGDEGELDDESEGERGASEAA
ncbi:sugar ABC transporter ATP-binding protein [Halobacteriales archaeon QS_5_68_33]|nr:MAG: sugar ABC transporter ATP-binding protein [Halobacteriales archaeon QS_5_68_33]